jgi:hypothetical protein
MTDLLKLVERVETGEIIGMSVVSALGLRDMVFPDNPLTSLDAAKALHDAVLPDWDWIASKGDALVISLDHQHRESGRADNPAAAWVAAILRAKASEVKDD